jgi:hypothetical protein
MEPVQGSRAWAIRAGHALGVAERARAGPVEADGVAGRGCDRGRVPGGDRRVMRFRRLAGAVVVMLAGVLASCGSTAAAPAVDPSSQVLRFGVFVKTVQKLDSVLWTGRQFLFVQNTANTVWAAPPAGRPLRRFASMPRLVEETRCVLSPGRHGFPAGAIFCHSPDNKMYEISANGSSQTVFATLPARYPPAADGALAFDADGRFGYRLLAATGRSGGRKPSGGRVYAIDAHGRVQQVGSYPGPGGADELVVAPHRFGSVAGDALLTVDAGAGGGTVVAMDPSGRTRAVAKLPRGLSPIAAIPRFPRGAPRTRAPKPGLYLTDDKTGSTYMAPAAAFARYSGDVIVGTESPRALFWILEPKGKGFAAISLPTNLPAGSSLEQAIFVG